MINILDKNKINEHKNSLVITYPRKVEIIFGTYFLPELIHQFIMEIKNNLNSNMENYTNVKGGMTDWTYFLNKPSFTKFITYLINNHQTTHPNLFQYFFSKNIISDAWGNEIKKGDLVSYHEHPCYHGILYLTKGCDLILPELNLKITPQPGEYYIFPPNILHGFDASKNEEKRYSLIFNMAKNSPAIYNLEKEIKKIHEKNS